MYRIYHFKWKTFWRGTHDWKNFFNSRARGTESEPTVGDLEEEMHFNAEMLNKLKIWRFSTRSKNSIWAGIIDMDFQDFFLKKNKLLLNTNVEQ